MQKRQNLWNKVYRKPPLKSTGSTAIWNSVQGINKTQEMEMSIQTSKIYLSNITNTQKKPPIYSSKTGKSSKNPLYKGIYKQENWPSCTVHCWQQRCFTAIIAWILPLQNNRKASPRNYFCGKTWTEGWTTTITRYTKHKERQTPNSGSAKLKKNGFFPPILLQRKILGICGSNFF